MQIITLRSASYCRENNISFNEGMVKKGKLMGTKQDQSAHFQFDLTKSLKLEDKTTY